MFNFHDKRKQRIAAGIIAVIVVIAMVVPAVISALF